MPKLNQIFRLLMYTSIIWSGHVAAQSSDSTRRIKKVYCNCNIKGLPRPKGLTIRYEMRPSYGINTTDRTGTFGNSSNTIQSNARFEVKAKVPVINKPYLSIVGGFRYYKEQYKFRELGGSPNPLYKSFEDRSLKSIGANLIVIIPMRSNKYWVLRTAANLNGDYKDAPISKTNYLKFSISPALGWKKNDDLTYAVGLTYAYNFGRPLVFPTFAINYNLDNRWSLESVLPIFAKFRYGINENFYWYNGIEVDGAAYRLNNTEASLAGFQSLHLHRSELRLTSSLEKQLKGWIWAGLELGAAHNLSYNLTNSASGRSDIIFKNKLKDGLLINFSLFLLPPKELYRRFAD